MHTTKDFRLQQLKFTDAGTFTGLASVYNNVDLQGDVVKPGAFTKTLAERGSEIPILWQHRQDAPIGTGVVTDTQRGLQIVGTLSLGTAQGHEAYTLLKDGVIKGLSIGYDVVKQAYRNGVREILEIKLFETSLVTFAANELATISAVKAELKAGRTLSAASRQHIQTAIDGMTAHGHALSEHGAAMAAHCADLQKLLDMADADEKDVNNDDDDEDVIKSLRQLNNIWRTPSTHNVGDAIIRNFRKLSDVLRGN